MKREVPEKVFVYNQHIKVFEVKAIDGDVFKPLDFAIEKYKNK